MLAEDHHLTQSAAGAELGQAAQGFRQDFGIGVVEVGAQPVAEARVVALFGQGGEAALQRGLGEGKEDGAQAGGAGPVRGALEEVRAGRVTGEAQRDFGVVVEVVVGGIRWLEGGQQLVKGEVADVGRGGHGE